MLDIKFVKENPELVKENIKKKFKDSKLPLVDEAIRLYDEKRQAVKVGDTVEFTCTEDGEVLSRRVKALHTFASFAELYGALPLERCGYTEENIARASPSDMEQYYSVEEQNHYGVVGIEIELI